MSNLGDAFQDPMSFLSSGPPPWSVFGGTSGGASAQPIAGQTALPAASAGTASPIGAPLPSGQSADVPSPLPPFAPVDDATRAAITAQINQQLDPSALLAPAVGTALRIARASPWTSLLAGLATRPFAFGPTRQAIGQGVGDTITGQIQDEINRANNAYGYQQLLNAGGFPR